MLVFGSDFIEDWVKLCLPARLKVKQDHDDLPLEDQCTKCEKVRSPAQVYIIYI